MPTLRQSVLVRAPVAVVRDALLDSASLSRILGHDCQSSRDPGGEFSLWDGLIRGHNVKVGQDEVVQVWRYAMPGWPEGLESNVVLRFVAEGESTRVHLGQTHIPAGCGEAVEEHWRDHVWPGLKALVEAPERHEVGRRFFGFRMRAQT